MDDAKWIPLLAPGVRQHGWRDAESAPPLLTLVVLQTPARERGWSGKVLSPPEREGHRLFIDDAGKLRRAADGKLFDSRSDHNFWSVGRAMFVVDGCCNLYASQDGDRNLHHPSFLGGVPVFGAGEIAVHDGELVDMTDRSGHFRPTPELNDRVLKELLAQGLRPASEFKKLDWNGRLRT